MKKGIPFLLIVLFFSCSIDEIDSLLVGTWDANSFITSEPVDENGDGIKNIDLKKEMECVAMVVDFSSRGEFSIESTDAIYDFNYVDGKLVLEQKGCGVQHEKGNWNINASSTKLFLEFIIDGNDQANLVEVNIELTESLFIMKDLVFDEGENTITYTVEFARK